MSPLKKALISLFVVFHIVAAIDWVLPGASFTRQNLTPLVTPYVIPVGLWQAWNMFSPNPSNLNLYMHATVRNSDGSTWDYELPRMDKLGFLERYKIERVRKHVENVHLDANRVFWPDLARWIAQEDRKVTGKTPVHVDVYRTWWEVPPPAGDTSQPPLQDWHTYLFYQADIKNGAPA